MKDTEAIRILNDLAKDAIGSLKEKICGHIDTILDRIEAEEKELQATTVPEVERKPSENAQKAEETPEKSSGGALIRSKGKTKEKPSGGRNRSSTPGN